MMSSWDECQNNKSARRMLLFCSLIVWKHGQKEKAELPVENAWTEFGELTWLTAKPSPWAESWTQCLAGAKEGPCPLTPGGARAEAAGILKAGRKWVDGSVGQLVSLCLSGHGAEHSGFCPAWSGDRGVVRAVRTGMDIRCWAPGTPHLAGVTLQPQPQAHRGLRDWCCGCWLMDSPRRPICEKDLSLQEGSINPFWSRSQFSCQGNTLGAAQGLCL